jgi:hypothetical protein
MAAVSPSPHDVPTSALERPRPLATSPAWGSLEVFVLVLFLSSALLFVPGAQAARGIIRALPYAASLGMWALTWNLPDRAKSAMPGKGLLVAALVLMALNVVHPDSNMIVGVAQTLLQLTIVAPVFWAGRLVTGLARLERLLNLIFLANAASCVVGLLQILDPDRFMPPEFTRLGLQMRAELVRSMTYTSTEGVQIIRPVGLTDMPGGAAIGSAITGVLGLMLAAQPRRAWWLRVGCLLLAGAGMLTLYLCQVRSLLVMLVVVCVVLCLLLTRLGRAGQATTLAVLGAGLLMGSFAIAWTIGGDSVFDRFYGLVDQGVVTSYQTNRGTFLEYTFTTLLGEYPFGAGIGRWGMTFVYFSPFESHPSPSLWAEIQMTGWLLDGGFPLMVLYSAAIGVSLLYAWRISSRGSVPRLGYLSAVVLSLNLFVVGQSFAGPVFNTMIGIQFWLLAAGLHGAVSTRIRNPSR